MTPERFARLRTVLQRRQPDLTVLMDGVHKPHNLSAVARSCDAVGVLEVHAVTAPGVDELHHEVSAGTSKWLSVVGHDSIASAARELREADFSLVAAHPDPAAVDFRTLDYTRPTALVVGAELHGLSAEALGVVDHTVVVPMVGMVQSLNVSVATAVILYEAQRQRESAGAYDTPRLAADRLRALLFEWAYPELAARCREAELDYPALDADGAIVEMPPLPGLVPSDAGSEGLPG